MMNCFMQDWYSKLIRTLEIIKVFINARYLDRVMRGELNIVAERV